MVMAQSLFMTLKRLDANAPLDVLAPAWTEPLLARMPEVRRAIPAPFGHGSFDLGARRRLGRSLREAGYGRAIVLPNSWKSALVPWFAGIGQRTGWRGEFRHGLLNDVRVLDKPAFPLMIDRFNALAFAKGRIAKASDFPAPHPQPRLAADAALAIEAADARRLDRSSGVLALCPGAEFGPSKRWPEGHFAAVAGDAIAAGRQVWLFGSAKDAPVCEAIRAALLEAARERCISLAGRTSLGEAVDLLSLADAVVSNDSGLMHVAAALGRPLAALYGSTSPGFTPPLTGRRAMLREDLPCSPCFKRECPLGHHDCMRKLEPKRVVDALAALERAA